MRHRSVRCSHEPRPPLKRSTSDAMETREPDRVRSVADRLEQLTPPADWTPSLAKNRARLRARIGAHSRRRLRLMTADIATAVVLGEARESVVRGAAQPC